MQAQARICPVCYDDHSAIYACENDNLLEAIATRDAEIERLRADLVWAARHCLEALDGEFYPCKPDIFAATYEEVSDGE